VTSLENISFDIGALHSVYERGTTPAEVMRESLRRIAATNDPGIFLHLRSEADLVAEADALPAFDPVAYPLWGVPFAIKDNIDLAGAPTTAACPDFAYEPDDDAFVVARLRAAGAVPLGKTNLDQFATGLVGVRTPFPVPRNAIDPEIVPGGSSSGSAVAVSRGLVSFALGTDTAGSGRVPAALNNIVGLKPTLGALSASGVVPACRTLDTVSIFALTVGDAWAALRVAAAPDEADPYSRPIAVPTLGVYPPATRIGIPDAQTREFFGDTFQSRAFDRAIDRLLSLGATLVEIDFTPFYEVAQMLYEGAWVAERMTVIDGLLAMTPDAVLPVTREIIGAANDLSAVDAFRGIYRLAELRRRAERVTQEVDLLCVPTIPTFYSCADLDADPVGPNSRLGTYTNFVNLMDMCAIAVPTGPREDGRPGSVTLLAAAGHDALAATLAEAIHEDAVPNLGATHHTLLPHENRGPSALAPGEVEIAVVGAHMSGLPLNDELTSRGGRFIEATRTAPAYRLFALPGGPPKRPGLLRVRGGAGIALEIWALPVLAFGEFVASIPSPLSIGTLTLEDGRAVKGFLVEAAATEGAQEITYHGGWRSFCEAVAE